MCGITGYFALAGTPTGTPATLARMCTVMTHRGPDDQGTWIEGPVGLGMRRLAVIDPSGGKQPATNEDQAIHVVFNGEIYNHGAVRRELENRGHRPGSRSDTEIIPHLYEEHGLDFALHLTGMFAIALHDTPRQRLVLARDRLGEKPLYYTRVGDELIFGSELKCLLAHPAVERRLSLPALSRYLLYEYVPAPHAILEGVHKLPPGCLLVAEDGQMMTEATFSVRNNGRQFLEVALPAGAQVWSAFVAGQAVRPTLREGKLLLPLERTGSDEGAISVELTYVSAQKFPATRGNVEMISPALDVPVKEAQWELYLPVDFNYQKFAGTMARIEAEAAPVAVAFSATDYEKGEVQRRKERRLESSSFLSRARSNVAAGKLKEAARYYKGAKSTRDLAEKDESVVQLGEELKKAQSSNLILGQRLAFENNADMFRQGVDQPVQQQSVAAYDMKAAEQQVEKLQRAQEVAIAKVRPLRVHLPTTGLRHSFAQILQTEIGKPMSIRFLAANAKAPSWTGRIAGVVLGFVVLWAVVALALKRRTESAT